MIDIKDKDKCCGCTSCMQACPKKCIEMKEDFEGFLYPKVNMDKCVDCHQCEKACPIINRNDKRKPIVNLAIKNNDEQIRTKSSSGGIFYLLAKQTIEDGGVVFGAKFDDRWNVVIDHADTLQGVEAFMGSKYVQASVGDAYKNAKKFLRQGLKVLFTGCPCQIAGLKRYLGSDYPNLLTMDFVCHGVPSPKVWRYYLIERLQKMTGTTDVANISDIQFRNKSCGWKTFSFSIETKYDEMKRESEVFWANPYMKAFVENVILRPSCYKCKFREFRSGSDITIGDFWTIGNIDKSLDDDKGISLVALHTTENVVHTDDSMVTRINVSYDSIINNNEGLSLYTSKHPNRDSFFRKFNNSNGVTQDLVAAVNLSFWGKVQKKIAKEIAKFVSNSLISH